MERDGISENRESWGEVRCPGHAHSWCAQTGRARKMQEKKLEGSRP